MDEFAADCRDEKRKKIVVGADMTRL